MVEGAALLNRYILLIATIISACSNNDCKELTAKIKFKDVEANDFLVSKMSENNIRYNVGENSYIWYCENDRWRVDRLKSEIVGNMYSPSRMYLTDPTQVEYYSNKLKHNNLNYKIMKLKRGGYYFYWDRPDDDIVRKLID